MKEKFYRHIENLQDSICKAFERVDGKSKFTEDLWNRKGGGGGRTNIISNGDVFEKGGVNISSVYGKLPLELCKQFKVEKNDFSAFGLSLVIHPRSPLLPTVHANWRYFEMYDEKKNIHTQWFAGVQDLTPYYLFEEDAYHFHSVCKEVCDRYDPSLYPIYKKNCDTYFWNIHRDEARGIGGLFFDYLKPSEDKSLEQIYQFIVDLGHNFLESYIPIVESRKTLPYTDQQRKWQEIRRGRYVEFNLVYDRGTVFGLKTNGRIESILMSLPPKARWEYCHKSEKSSEEEKLLKVLKHPREWLK